MSLTAIQSQILQPFINETLTNLKSMAGMQGRVDEGFVDRVDQFRFKGYAICAETDGGIDGVMIMHHYVETAVAMGNAVRRHALGEEDDLDEITATMADALAEWGNTVLGRATRTLGNHKLDISFEAPYFVFDTDAMDTLLKGVTDIVTVPVHVDGVGRFYFNYLIRTVSSDMVNTENEDTPLEAGHCVMVDKRGAQPLDFKKKILVVDDMKMIRTSLKLYLKELGYEEVIEAASGQEAIDKHGSEKPDFIFMDVVMPEMTGTEALKLIREYNSDTPIVMLTSVADKNVINQCEALGIDGYVLKPLTWDTGPAVLKRFLRQ